MKTPDYVATVTRIYRKYIDDPTNIDEDDKKDLLQVFNRGNFSTGHFSNLENKKLVFPDKQNNMGLYLGNIANYNSKKGYIKIELNEDICIGDTISIEGETGEYTVSEIVEKNQNIKFADRKSVVTLGRMKGNIKIGAKVYKLSNKFLSAECKTTYKETANIKKIPIDFDISVKQNKPISVSIKVNNCPPFYENIFINHTSAVIPVHSEEKGISRERIIEQFSKLGDTPYYIDQINVNLDNNICIPHISDLNAIRRKAIELLEAEILNKFNFRTPKINYDNYSNSKKKYSKRKISVLLEQIDLNMDYSLLDDFDNLYIPLKFFTQGEYKDLLIKLSQKYTMYIYMPTIMKANYKNLLLNNIDEIISKFNVKGFVLSNVAGFKFLEKYTTDYELVANYTMNIFNSYTIKELKTLGTNIITPSIELNSDILEDIINNSKLPVEVIAYGRAILMNSAYCLLGKSNKCYPDCEARCKKGKKYYLKDRYGYKFRVMPDNVQTVTSIYNSKIASIDTTDYNIYSVRINILDENINEINDIIEKVKSGGKLSGKEYTNGNLKRDI